MKVKYSIFLILTVFVFSCTSKKAFNKKISSTHPVQKQIADLKIVKNSLEQNHPGLYWYISKKELDFKFDSLESIINSPATSLEFYRQLASVVASVKCGHTKMNYPGLKLSKFQKDSIKKAGDRPLSQIFYFVDSNRLFISSVKKKELSDTLKGTEILAIDDVNASEIIRKAESLYASDGYNQTFYPAVLNRSFDAYYYLSYGKSDSSKLTLKRNDSIYNYWLKTIKPVKEDKKLSTPQEIGEKKIADKNAKKLKRKNRYKGVDQFGKPLLDLKYDSLLSSTAIMTVRSFSFDHANFRKFFRQSFQQLEEKKIENLILDVRNNGGGSLMACNRLFRYLYNQSHQFTGQAYTKNSFLKPIKYEEKSNLIKVLEIGFYPVRLLSKLMFERKDSLGHYAYLPTAHLKNPLKNVFEGKLLVLTNGFSFSATSLLSANLQSVKRGTFIGVETGGGYNQCTAGRIPFVNLPNTGLKLRLPLKTIDIVDKRKLYGRGVFPDVEVTDSIEDVLANKDGVMEKAKLIVGSANHTLN